MKETKNQELYSSPEAKVIEIKVRQILCQSNPQTGSLGTMEATDGAW